MKKLIKKFTVPRGLYPRPIVQRELYPRQVGCKIAMFLTTILSTVLIGVVTQPSLALPDGAVARLGKGWISGGVQFSPDGNLLAVATSAAAKLKELTYGNV